MPQYTPNPFSSYTSAALSAPEHEYDRHIDSHLLCGLQPFHFQPTPTTAAPPMSMTHIRTQPQPQPQPQTQTQPQPGCPSLSPFFLPMSLGPDISIPMCGLNDGEADGAQWEHTAHFAAANFAPQERIDANALLFAQEYNAAQYHHQQQPINQASMDTEQILDAEPMLPPPEYYFLLSLMNQQEATAAAATPSPSSSPSSSPSPQLPTDYNEGFAGYHQPEQRVWQQQGTLVNGEVPSSGVSYHKPPSPYYDANTNRSTGKIKMKAPSAKRISELETAAKTAIQKVDLKGRRKETCRERFNQIKDHTYGPGNVPTSNLPFILRDENPTEKKSREWRRGQIINYVKNGAFKADRECPIKGCPFVESSAAASTTTMLDHVRSHLHGFFCVVCGQIVAKRYNLNHGNANGHVI